jgi:hypothetical protein
MAALHEPRTDENREDPLRRSGTATRQIDRRFVQRLEARLHSRKPGHIMEQLGISLNTWDKLLAGEPIRPSVAERLLDRFREF